MLSRPGERDRTTDAGTRAAAIAITATPSRTKATHLAVLLDPEDEPSDDPPAGGTAARGEATTAPDPPVGAEGGPPLLGATDRAGGRRAP